MFKIGITGHRELLNESEVRKNIYFSLRYFKETQTDIIGITALAAGSDTIFAKEIEYLGGKLNIVLPFIQDEYRKDFIDDNSKKELDSFLKRYGNKIQINNNSIPTNKNERDAAYFSVGKRIVDESDILLAVWDNQESNGIGGTADIITYAKGQGKQVHVIKGIRVPNDTIESIDQQFEKLDREAIKYKETIFQPIWWSGLITGVLAVVCFAIIVSFLHTKEPLSMAERNVKFVLAILEVIFLSISFILLSFFANKWKYKFLEKRRATEYLRSLILFKNAQIPIFPLANTYDTYYSEDVKDILTVERQMAADEIVIRDQVNTKRMLWCLADEQASYHEEKRVNRFTTSMKRIHIGCAIVKVVFLLAVTCKFGIEMLEHPIQEVMSQRVVDELLSICIFTVILMPSLYAMLEGIKYFGDWKRKIKTSKLIIADLAEIKKRILEAANEQDLIAEAKVLCNVLDRENIEWLSQYLILDIEAKV